jgi:hypothetical protein
MNIWPWPTSNQRTLAAILANTEKIIMSQGDIDAADQAIKDEVTGLAADDMAIETAQTKLLATIAGLQAGGLNTTELVADTAALLQAHGASESVIAALTAAAG